LTNYNETDVDGAGLTGWHITALVCELLWSASTEKVASKQETANCRSG
jgi:hypothetical protein